mgnify:FL=1|tara:strand:- start:7289 stop:7972 length:684 start_codon:yes stop_codon:yes gene_type:complete
MSEKVTSEVIGYVNPQTGEVLPVNAVPLPPDESRPTNLKPKRKPDHSKKEIDLGFGIFIMDRVEYTDTERTTLRIFYEDNGEKEFTLLEGDPSRKWLVDQIYALTDKDTIMENTYQRIVAEEAAFKEFAIKEGKAEGYLIDPIAYYDSDSNSAKVDTKFYTHAIKLFFGPFNEEKQKEDLFICKLAAFELDVVKNCVDKELKSKLRKVKTPLEVIETLIEIKKSSEE